MNDKSTVTEPPFSNTNITQRSMKDKRILRHNDVMTELMSMTFLYNLKDLPFNTFTKFHQNGPTGTEIKAAIVQGVDCREI